MRSKTCPECGDTVRGRADKKFCSDACRNSFNNRQNSDVTGFMRNVNNLLRRNRRILQECMSEASQNKLRVATKFLTYKGFEPDYFTNTWTDKAGSTYCFCYEYGYLKLDEDWYMLLRREA